MRCKKEKWEKGRPPFESERRGESYLPVRRRKKISSFLLVGGGERGGFLLFSPSTEEKEVEQDRPDGRGIKIRLVTVSKGRGEEIFREATKKHHLSHHGYEIKKEDSLSQNLGLTSEREANCARTKNGVRKHCSARMRKKSELEIGGECPHSNAGMRVDGLRDKKKAQEKHALAHPRHASKKRPSTI